jgi:hypothetical protein
MKRRLARVVEGGRVPGEESVAPGAARLQRDLDAEGAPTPALLGPVFYRLLLSGGALDRGLGTRLVDAILEGFAPRATTRAAAGRRSAAGNA